MYIHIFFCIYCVYLKTCIYIKQISWTGSAELKAVCWQIGQCTRKYDLCSILDFFHQYAIVPCCHLCTLFSINHNFSLYPKVCFIYFLVDYQPLKYNRWYVYPDWAYALGWLMALSSMMLVPGWALGRLCTLKGSLRQVRTDTKE